MNKNNFYSFVQKKTQNIFSKPIFFKYLILILLLSIIINFQILTTFFKSQQNRLSDILLNQTIRKDSLDYLSKTNIDYNEEFFQIREVSQQIYNKSLKYISTIAGGRAAIGNSLIMLNKLINICERIRCSNIIAPESLQKIIKNPIHYKAYNITILPNSYKDKIKIDIQLSTNNNFYFFYRNRPFEMRLSIIRDEVLHNIPKCNINQDNLVIHIRSGDIFTYNINPNYAQPPLCFYEKIINENNYSKIFIVSSGNENPVINQLLKLYNNITFIHGFVEEAISFIVNAYNLIMSSSTFVYTLIWINQNLKNLYIYQITYFNLTSGNYTKHIMKPSSKYLSIMKEKWQKTAQQLDLMLNENCKDSNITSFIN